MAPSTILEEENPSIEPFSRNKRIKLTQTIPFTDEDDDDSFVALPPHPLDVKPAGNAYTASEDVKSRAGMFTKLPDELLNHFLETLDATSLIRLGSTCRLLYACTRADELWRSLFVEASPEDFTWRGTWRSTYLDLPKERISSISCKNLFSDVLYRPFQCAHTSLKPFVTGIPRENCIPRISDLTNEEFAERWFDKPFILTAPVREWPIWKKWTPETLLEKYPDVKFRAEAVDWPLRTYVEYMKNSSDESPLYVFDRAFVEKMGIKATKGAEDAAYWPPTCFGEDLFDVLGEQRPDRRWLIMGPKRSGSTFHKDPNATSAWNAILTGSKYWLMFPSSSSLPPPPGVIVSEDQSEITSPLSIAEYLLTFHELARETPGCREGICYAGEVLHVPSGWFHLVLNLDDSLALTQNFVPLRRLADVLGFLRDQKESISGFSDEVADPYQLFVERLREKHPDILEEGLEVLKRKGKKGGGRGKWEQLVKDDNDEEERGGFSFGFGGDDDDEVP